MLTQGNSWEPLWNAATRPQQQWPQRETERQHERRRSFIFSQMLSQFYAKIWWVTNIKIPISSLSVCWGVYVDRRKNLANLLRDSHSANSFMSANFWEWTGQSELSAAVEVKQEGSVRLMGPWPHAASWPQSLPVFARPEFGRSRALTIRTAAALLLRLCHPSWKLIDEVLACFFPLWAKHSQPLLQTEQTLDHFFETAHLGRSNRRVLRGWNMLAAQSKP